MEYLLDDRKENTKYIIGGFILIDVICLLAVLNLSWLWNFLLLVTFLGLIAFTLFQPRINIPAFFMLLIIYTAPLERWNWKIWFTLRPIIVISLLCFCLILLRHSLVKLVLNRKTRQVLILFFILITIFVASSLNALDYIKSFRVTVLNVTLFILFFVVVHLTREIKDLRRYLSHWMIIGFLLSLFGLSQLIGALYGLDLDALIFSRFKLIPYGRADFNIIRLVGFRIYSLFQDSNNFAAFLNTVFPFFLASAIYFRSLRKLKISLFFLIGGMIVGSCLILTLSRSSWVGLLFGLAVISWDKRKQIFNSKNIKYFGLFLIVLVLLINPFLKYLTHSFTARLAVDESTKIHRFVAEAAISMFWKNPILGVGIGNWGEYYARHYKPGHENWNAHSAYLHILSEVGIIGFIIYATLAFLILKQILYFKANTSGYNSEVLGCGLLAGFIALLGANIFYQNFTFQFFIVFLALAFASGNIIQRIEKGTNKANYGSINNHSQL